MSGDHGPRCTGGIGAAATRTARAAERFKSEEPLDGRLRSSDRAPSVIKSVEFFNIELTPLADGMIHVSLAATTVDEEEPQLLSQEIVSECVATIDEALAVISEGVII